MERKPWAVNRTSVMVSKSLAKGARKAAIDANLTLQAWVERAIRKALDEQYRRGRRHADTASA
jgi:post-segregation antitoxin (ccd killing protein)